MPAYFNEHDPHAAAWLRELIRRGLVADGDVDERSIEDVCPEDLRGYDQCHFFAGVGVWSHALRRAGWPDDRPVWTGSCPCQPFSSAGKGAGFADERHLWPAFFHLISVCRPVVCFGEQVEGKDGLPWLDLVCADLEGDGYAVGTVVTPAAGYGAPHARHRLYWVADAAGERRPGDERRSGSAAEPVAPGRGEPRALADGEAERRAKGRSGKTSRRQPVQPQRLRDARELGHADGSGPLTGRPSPTADGHRRATLTDGGARELGDPLSDDMGRDRGAALGAEAASSGEREQTRLGDLQPGQPGPVGGFWADAEWLPCKPEPKHPAGRWRPVEPGTFPLAHGAPARVVKLRGYGNGLVAPQAVAFIEAYLEATKE